MYSKGELQMKPYHLILDFTHVYDDFMADGEAATGAIRLLRMAHATVARLE